MITFIKPQSFHPPALPDIGSSYPDHVLLCVRAYIADRTNETTATSFTSEGHRIQVSFFAAEPPALSYLCVYCPDAAFTSDPLVIACQGNLILFNTAIRSSHDPFGEDICCDYFVYSADGTGGSSLDRLPALGRHLNPDSVGLVAPGSQGGGYAVALLSTDPSGKRWILRVHREKTALWRTKIVPLLTESAGKGLEEGVPGLAFNSTKTVALQGSKIAWVDLQRAAVLCDVLANDLVAYYIPLPEPLNDKNKEYLQSTDPWFFRDAIGRKDSIKFVEMEYRRDGEPSHTAAGGWRAVTYSWTIGSKKWHTDSEVELSADMLSLLCPDRNRDPPLCIPTLCDLDNVLYLISKPNCRGPKGSVVAVDISKKTLKSVIPMSEERVTGYVAAFVHSTFSKCFNGSDVWPKMVPNNAFFNVYIGKENYPKAVDKVKGLSTINQLLLQQDVYMASHFVWERKTVTIWLYDFVA